MKEDGMKVEELQADIERGVAELVEGEESELPMGSFPAFCSVTRVRKP
jgi:hypothetical protein